MERNRHEYVLALGTSVNSVQKQLLTAVRLLTEHSISLSPFSGCKNIHAHLRLVFLWHIFKF